MKKWSGGVLIIVLAMILVSQYRYAETPQPKRQSAYDFFNNHPTDDPGDDVKLLSQTKVKTLSTQDKKPHLIHLEGLGDLFIALKNVSEDESKPLLVWAQMRLLLSRSDALPDTAQGVKEAATAWKELWSQMEKDKALAGASNQSNILKENECPYSVTTFNRTVPSDQNILEIPCGLVEDSSITVIGIPDGRNGSLQIELIGSKLPEDPKHPIILHYNVCIPGDNVTEEPVIMQNTWTNELGWGKQEICPDHNSTKTVTVDGLVNCNEQVVRSPLEENANVSHHPSSDKLNNVSSGSGHLSANFPFVEGNPFTATLWVGVEGFHMTVNGRHETSFAYREKLEPWSVNGVKLADGFDLIYALAKGLPVYEDLDLVVDVENLKAPPVPKRRLVLLIGVFSTGNNFERRMALRRSWMQYEAVRSGDVAVRFFIGLDKNWQVNFKLWREAQAYGDIQLMPFVDYYSLLSLKTIAICIFGTKILPAKYIMKTDDDAFVRIDEVLSSLKGRVANGILYGLISFESAPHRDKDNKWYISTEEWPHDSFPPWAHGPGYLISRDIAKFIVQGHQERDLKLFKLEDVAMGIWIEQYKKHGHEVQYMSDDRFHNAGCEPNYVLAHYQNPRMVLCLWENLQKEQEASCCE